MKRKVQASLIVEASFVMCIVIMAVCSMIVISLLLGKRTGDSADVRLNLESHFSEVMLGQASQKTFSEGAEGQSWSIWPGKTLSYTESDEKTFTKASEVIYGARIFKKLTE